VVDDQHAHHDGHACGLAEGFDGDVEASMMSGLFFRDAVAEHDAHDDLGRQPAHFVLEVGGLPSLEPAVRSSCRIRR